MENTRGVPHQVRRAPLFGPRAPFDCDVSPFTAPPQQALRLGTASESPRTFTMLVNRHLRMRAYHPLASCLPSPPMTSKIGQGAGGLCYKARREGG